MPPKAQATFAHPFEVETHRWRAHFYRTLWSVLRGPAEPRRSSRIRRGVEQLEEPSHEVLVELRDALHYAVPGDRRDTYQAALHAGALDEFSRCDCGRRGCNSPIVPRPPRGPGPTDDLAVLGRLADEYAAALLTDPSRASWLEGLQREFLPRCWACVLGLSLQLRSSGSQARRLIGEGLAVLLTADLERFGVLRCRGAGVEGVAAGWAELLEHKSGRVGA